MTSLNPTVLIIGISCLTFFITWLLGRRVDTLKDAFEGLTAGLVAFGALLLAPFFFYSGWHQMGAKERLARETLPVSADLGYAVGAQGGRSPRFIWRFQARADPATILAYYETHAPASGWKVERRKNGLLLSKPEGAFAIRSEEHGGNGEMIFQKQKTKTDS